MRRRLFFWARPWASRTHKVTATLFFLVFACLILWSFVSEVGVFHWNSLSWKWPLPYPDVSSPREKLQNIRNRITKGLQDNHPTLPTRTYYQTGDTHHYVLHSTDPMSMNIKRANRHSSRFRDRREFRTDHSLKVLVLSDPHIMCTHDKEEWWLARWDADHYLRRSFSYLFPRLQPDLIIFLGDVFSNGFEASQSQWDSYVQCLKDIYPIFNSSEREKLIVAMGDNDLGGEGRDYMTETAYRRYEETFGDLNIVFEITGGVRIIKITTTCFIRPPANPAEEECRHSLIQFLDNYSRQQSIRSSTPPLTILVSHVPLNLLHRSRHIQHKDRTVDIKTKIILSVMPGIVISGHVHHQEYTLHSLDTDGGQVISNEITVPTCSYRMGEKHMGVGTAIISEGGNMSYRVNWLPSRYPFLVGYSILIVIIGVLSVVMICRRR